MSSEVETRTVDTHVKRLREKLGSGRDLLETVRGIGYRLVDPAREGVRAMLGRTPLAAAIRALRAELAGGPRADLGRDVRELARAPRGARAAARDATPRDPPEQELLAALPDAAALVSREGWVRVSNAAFDTLAATRPRGGAHAARDHAQRRALGGGAARARGNGAAARARARRGATLPRPPRAAAPRRGAAAPARRDRGAARRGDAARLRREREPRAPHADRGDPRRGRDAARRRRRRSRVARAASSRSSRATPSGSARLTQDLLDLSRIESRQWRLELAPVDAAPLAPRSVELLAARGAREGARARARRCPARRARPRRRARARAGAREPRRQRGEVHARSGSVTIRGGARRRRVGAVGRRHRPRHRAPPPAAHLRALLPRRPGPLARAGRHRARPRDREAPRPGAWAARSASRAARSGSRFWVRLPAA